METRTKQSESKWRELLRGPVFLVQHYQWLLPRIYTNATDTLFPLPLYFIWSTYYQTIRILCFWVEEMPVFLSVTWSPGLLPLSLSIRAHVFLRQKAPAPSMSVCLPWNDEGLVHYLLTSGLSFKPVLRPQLKFCPHRVLVSALRLLFFLQGLVLSKGILSSDTHQLFSPFTNGRPSFWHLLCLSSSNPSQLTSSHTTYFCLGANAFLWTGLIFLTRQVFTFFRAQTLAYFSWYLPMLLTSMAGPDSCTSKGSGCWRSCVACAPPGARTWERHFGLQARNLCLHSSSSLQPPCSILEPNRSSGCAGQGDTWGPHAGALNGNHLHK